MRTRRRWLGVLSLLLAGMLACSGQDDAPTDPVGNGVPMISVADLTVAEGSTALFTVSLDKIAAGNVSFSFATADVTATAPDDYTATSGVDTITAGNASVTILVATTDDALVEGPETFFFTVAQVSGAGIIDSAALATIADDDSTSVGFVTIVQPILQANCARVGCHGGGSASGGLSLGSADYSSVLAASGINTAQFIVADGRVVQPGNSALSTLYTKTIDPPPFPARMPLNGPPFLFQEAQNAIRDWIDQGALDN